jgi:hypothetical protein
VPIEQRTLSCFDNRGGLRAGNPLGRILIPLE